MSDLYCFNAHDHGEWLSSGRSIDYANAVYLSNGSALQQPQHHLIKENLPLVKALARRYVGRTEEYEDLVQVGTIGLIKAIDRFDPTREVPLQS